MDPSTEVSWGVNLLLGCFKSSIAIFLFQPKKEPPARLHRLLRSEMDTKGLMWSEPVPLP